MCVFSEYCCLCPWLRTSDSVWSWTLYLQSFIQPTLMLLCSEPHLSLSLAHSLTRRAVSDLIGLSGTHAKTHPTFTLRMGRCTQQINQLLPLIKRRCTPNFASKHEADHCDSESEARGGSVRKQPHVSPPPQWLQMKKKLHYKPNFSYLFEHCLRLCFVSK